MYRLLRVGKSRCGMRAYSALVDTGALPRLCVWMPHGRRGTSVPFAGASQRSVLGSAAWVSSTVHAKRWQRGSGATDYYSILGVRSDASMDEIKAAYKRLALQYHPDRNSDPGAEEMFKSISEAYHVIGNRARRKEYDMGRRASSSTGGAAAAAGGAGGVGGHAYQSPPGYQQMSKEEADRLFRDLFGGVRVEQIFRDVEEGIRRGRVDGRNSRVSQEFSQAEQTFRPFFRSESTRIYTDAHGNRMEEHIYTDPGGTTFTVRRSTSEQPNASTKQEAGEYYRTTAESSRDGRFHIGNSSFNVKPPNATNDFGQAYFGVQTHGRHPLVAMMIIAAWGIVIGTFALVAFAFLISHPFFTLALLSLVLLKRRRFF